MNTNMDDYFEGLTKAGKELKQLISEAQIRIGMMESYFSLIQKELNKVEVIKNGNNRS